MKKFLFILMILFLAISCGQKVESSKAKFKIFTSNIVDPNAIFPGGLLVMGRSSDGLQSFTVPYTPGLVLDLKKGAWEFATIGWMGTTGIMEGNQQCSYQAVEINTDIFTINFNMNYQSCLTAMASDGSRFTHPMFYNLIGGTFNGFKKLNVVTCANLDSSCSTVNTTQLSPGSFRVEIPSDLKGIALTAGSTGIGKGLASSCVAGGVSNITPPHGGLKGFIGIQITTFSDGACSLTPKTYFFNHGTGQILNQTHVNSSGVSVLIRGALSVDSGSADASVALAPISFHGAYSLNTIPAALIGTNDLYVFTGTGTISGVSPTIASGNFLYYDPLIPGWTSFPETASVKLLLQNY